MLTAMFVLAIIEVVLVGLAIFLAIKKAANSMRMALVVLLIGLVSLALSVLAIITYFLVGAP